uniref:Reverse transcriptase domain-containing protein n=1 Tax=Triticum urartu TaxID=4572 RepID=A0A8R7PXK2_TRIUA
MEMMATTFYKNLYTSEGVHDMNRVLDTVPCKVTPAMNELLNSPYSQDEVKVALFQMFPTKAPGPDKFPAHFFQRQWEVCKDDITRVVLLKQVLPDIISKEQSAFVSGRLISDNIITAYECLHFMKRNKAKKHQSCALKLDMMKAYDRVEWEYLQGIMLKLGFSERWVGIVMGLVSLVKFSVLFNGRKLEEFTPSRGIRQGDPISPYLFLLAAEGLSC